MSRMGRVLWPLGGIVAGIVAALITWILLVTGTHLYADHTLVDAIRLNIQQSQSRNAVEKPTQPAEKPTQGKKEKK